MKRLAWSEVRSARQPGLKQELRVLIELLRVLPRPALSTQLTILPSNIMVGEDGSVLVGAARLEVSQQERYLAPEVQCGAEPRLPAAIYAVGALLFEAVTGHRFETREHVTQELAGARAMARAAGLGARFWEIYLLEAASKATEEQPEARWVSGGDFAEDLERVARDRIVTRAELGSLVAEVLEGRSSAPPARGSGAPDRPRTSGPPPLPKRGRRRSSSQKQKAVTAPAQAQRPAPIPRTDGDAPQMPLITALRVPARLKLPDPTASTATALSPPIATAPSPPTATAPSPPIATAPSPPTATAPSPPTAFAETEPPTLVQASASASAATLAPAPAASAFAETEPPTLVQEAPPATHASGSLNPVKLGPRIDPEPGRGRDLTPSVAPVVVPSLSAPPITSQKEAGESRHRTLTGTGDLREFEQQFMASIAAQAGRHGTLLGLGESTLSESHESWREPQRSSSAPPSSRQSSGPPGSERGAASERSAASGPPGSERGAASARTSSAGAPASSHPPSSTRSTSSSPPSYVYSPALDSGWDAAVPSADGGSILTDSSVPPFLPKKSLMGRVLLMVVVLVALGIGTFEMYGHFATPPIADGEKDPAEASPRASKLEKTRRGSEGDPDDASQLAARDSSPTDQHASAANAPAATDPEESSATDPTPPAPAVVPEASPADSPRAPASPSHPVPATLPGRPVAPPASRPKLPDNRDYGI